MYGILYVYVFAMLYVNQCDDCINASSWLLWEELLSGSRFTSVLALCVVFSFSMSVVSHRESVIRHVASC